MQMPDEDRPEGEHQQPHDGRQRSTGLRNVQCPNQSNDPTEEHDDAHQDAEDVQRRRRVEREIRPRTSQKIPMSRPTCHSIVISESEPLVVVWSL